MKNEYYIHNYLLNNSEIEKKYLDYIHTNISSRIYFYGRHFEYPFERYAIDYRIKLRQIVKKQLLLFQLFLGKFFGKVDLQEKKILSDAYFSVNHELIKMGYTVFRPPWWASIKSNTLPQKILLSKAFDLKNKLESVSFFELLSDNLEQEVFNFMSISKEYYQKINIDALFVSNDIEIFEKIAIDVFRELHKPSFIFLHGLPARYTINCENRSDYLIVWGDKIKENYVKIGFDPDKIIVSGHPYYTSFNVKKLRYSFDDILVLTNSIHPHPHLHGVPVGDRSNMITYLYMIKDALTSLGIKKVRLRVHPGESINWYLKYLDSVFFKPDKYNLKYSLNKASLVIGPASTVFLESVYYGVHYQIFEPKNEYNEVILYPRVPPFDGSDKRVPVAGNVEELKVLLKSREPLDLSFWNDYIKTPFDISFVKEIIANF
jgi:hypothetical protein